MNPVDDMSDLSGPAVCVVIAAYNAEATIARAVGSALAQPDVAEVIVVDDASTDNTAAAANAAEDGTGRLKVLVQTKNNGPAAARNRAISESTSEWIGILDADDFFLPGRIKALLAHREEADMIADDLWRVQEHAIDGPRTSLFPPFLRAPTHISFSEFVLSNMPRRGKKPIALGFIKPIIRRSFLEENSIKYQEHMRLGEDYELYARALASGARLLIIPAQGYVSVIRSISLSKQFPDIALLYLRDCNRHLMDIISLSRADKNALRRKYLHLDCLLQWRLLMRAVKDRNVKATLATFLRPYPVPFYLCRQCARHVYLQGLPKKKVRG